MSRVTCHALSISLPVEEGKPPPREFRIFAAGVNETDKGPIVFNDEAAAAVMAEYTRRGNRIVIDLEHDSINAAARVARNDAGDARARCDLAVRAGPELWAVNVDWTPDGADRVSVRRSQDSISPVVFFDSETRVAKEVFNLALVAQPAMHNAPSLAAGRTMGVLSMDPKIIQEALDALIAGDTTAALDVLKALVTEAATGEAGATGEADAAAAESADPKPPAAPGAPGEKDPAAAMAAALSAALGITARAPSEILAAVKTLQTKVDALELSRSADESIERAGLVGELVKLGVELPATAWENADKRVPVVALRVMPIADLRSRVAAFRAAPRTAAVGVPKRAILDVAALSASEQMAAEGITNEAARARFIAMRLAKKANAQ